MNHPTPAERAPEIVAGPALVCGLGAAIAMWVAAWITHLPGLALPGPVSGPVVLATWGLAAVCLGRRVPATQAIKVGLGAGLITAVVGLLILGSLLTEQPAGGEPAPGASGLRPRAVIAAGGFLVAGACIGLVGTLTGARLAAAPPGPPAPLPAPDLWLARLAAVTCVAFAPLLITGGAVTGTNSGMAIRGWPGSAGANMFLYPVSLMVSDPQRFLEHSHRLFGTLVGLSTLVLMVRTLLTRSAPSRARTLAPILFALVCVQGVVGGLRVLEDSRHAALLHGIVAQVVFALAVWLAVVLSPAWRGIPTTGLALERGPRFARLATALLHATLVQLVLGASFRHLKLIGSAGALHALYAHAALALVVVGLAMLVGFWAAHLGPRHADPDPSQGPRRALTRLGRALVAVVALQFLLGLLAFAVVMTDAPAGAPAPVDAGAGRIGGVPALRAALTTAHQANGALVLGVATMLWALLRRAAR